MLKTRKIIHIDEEKCDGCGQCVTACAEGAIQIIDGKAWLISESYCDGLGACLGECPQNAIRIEERPAEEFSPEAVHEHLQRTNGKQHAQPSGQPFELPAVSFRCPGSRPLFFEQREPASAPSGSLPEQETSSRLRNWPVQLHLVPLQAPYYHHAKLLITADCVPFAYADFHQRFLADHTLMIGCPKLDDAKFYCEKLTQILLHNDIESVEVLFMEVPCCFGLVHVVRQALEACGKDIPLVLNKIGVQGKVCEAAAV
ncbi:MAG: 4Fe-4S ferredoxin [Candidatus Omnitrophota bacterium]|jgi:NAD-dependent dihydropyrimidine dehydrogenase PreA subunit|nr:MAG: 4Fe-4S ferredoxin [Candidatus Omnitrophota bacterium]